MLSGSQPTSGHQPTITVRSLVSSLNPAKRPKLKENQMVLAQSAPPASMDGLLKRKQAPLGNGYVSAANIMPTPQRADSGQLLQVLQDSLSGPGASFGAKVARKPRYVGGAGTLGNVGKGTVTAVERRNARERNRVQQVNNGFAALRQRIPDEIAEAFENGTTARGVSKKLSKVETLRMAVEYIKSLERLLEYSSGLPEQRSGGFGRGEMPPGGGALPATPPPEPVGHPNFFLAIKPRSIGKQAADGYGQEFVPRAGPESGAGGACVDQTQITIINGHQYMRIPGTNTFRYLDPACLHEEDLESSVGHDFLESPQGNGQLQQADMSLLLDDDEEGDEDDTASSCLSSAIALSPQSNFTPDSDVKREVDSFYHSSTAPQLPVAQLDRLRPEQQQQQQHQNHQLQQHQQQQQQQQRMLPAPADEQLGFDQQQYEELMLIKSELEDEGELSEDPAFISWIETSQQLRQQLQQHQHILD